ncbi:MAG TPA: hypothetical protein VFG43_13150 [Geminicoccaceae bacterium]|nr:hypothetical protein [Geminicoccaceae bacterium]
MLDLEDSRRARASRRNGALSRGPTSDEGRRIASRNALRHGLAAVEPRLLPDEDADAFARYRAGILASLAPVGETRANAAEAVVWALWRQKRAWRVEGEFLAAVIRNDGGAPRTIGAALIHDPAVAAMFRAVERHLARLGRELGRALDAWDELRAQAPPAAAGPPAPEPPAPPADVPPDVPPDVNVQNEPTPAAAPAAPPPNRQQRRWQERQQRRQQDRAAAPRPAPAPRAAPAPAAGFK